MGFDWFKGFAPVSPPPLADYYPTWHNRLMQSNHTTWLSARNGSYLTLFQDYQRPRNTLHVSAAKTTEYFIYRSWLNFHTDDIPSDKTIVQAKLGLFVTAKSGLISNLIITKGLAREPIDEDKWAVQTDEVTVLGSILQSDILAGQFNWIDLNQTGIDWINHSALELKQHESYDWRRSTSWPAYGAIRFSQSFKPLFSHSLKKLRLRLRRAGNAGTLYVNITDTTPNGCSDNLPLAQDSIACLMLSTAATGAWQEFTFAHPPYVQDGHVYAIEIWCSGGNSSNYVAWVMSSSSEYPSGHLCYSNNGGSTWAPQLTWAAYFIEYECSNWNAFESRCDSNVGGTNFCLRTGFDVNNSPPGTWTWQSVDFYSAQMGVPWCPILKLTLQ